MTNPNDKRDAWRHPAAAGAAGRTDGGGKLTQRLAAGMIVLALVAAVLALLFYLREPPEPAFLAVPITQYEDRAWPNNPWAGPQADRLAARLDGDGDAVVAFDSQERVRLLSRLREFAEATREGSERRPLIVHLSACGLVYRGEAYVLPADAEPHKPETWLKVGELIEPVERAGGPRVMILDIEPVRSAALGAFGGDLAGLIEARLNRLREEGSLKFPVLVRAGHDANARTLRTRVPGYFLDLALGGLADGKTGDTEDRIVSSAEWVNYTLDGFADWAESGGTGDRLTLIGKVEDFRTVPAGDAASPELKPAPGKMPPWLEDSWKKLTDLRKNGGHLKNPLAYRRLEAACLRAQGRWLGGDADEGVKAELADEFRKAPDLNPWPLDRGSLAGWADSADPAVIAEAAEAVRPLLRDARAAAPKAPAGPLKPAKLPAAFSREKEPLPAEAAALLALRDVARGRAEMAYPEFARRAGIAVRAAKPTAEGLGAEFLRAWLAGNANPSPREREPETAPAFMQCLMASERAAVFAPRALPWVKAALENVDKDRRAALAKLLTGDVDGRRSARRELVGCVERYDAIGKEARTVADEFTRLGEAQTVLAAAVDYRPDDGDFQDNWLRLAEACLRVRELLETSGKIAAASPIKAPLAELLRRAEGARFETAADVEATLSWPRWPVPRRAELTARLSAASLKEVNRRLGGKGDFAPSATGDGFLEARLEKLLALAGVTDYEDAVAAWVGLRDALDGDDDDRRRGAEWVIGPFAGRAGSWESAAAARLKGRLEEYKEFLRGRRSRDAALVAGTLKSADYATAYAKSLRDLPP